MVSISIIIPVFNVVQYVRRCIESVMAQNINGASVECIVIDDCSPDKSMDIVQALVSEYQGPIQFSILKHDVNRGLSVARNNGIMHAKGDFVFFIDSDDYLMPDSIKYFMENLNKYPDVDMIIGNVMECKSGNSMINGIEEPCLIDDPDDFFSRLLQHKLIIYAWNKLIKRQLLINNHVFFEEGILYEDQCWSYQLFSVISSVLLLPRLTYVYEHNQNSIVNTTFTLGNADKVVWSYTVSINKMLDNPPSPKKFCTNLTPQYLLFMLYFAMNGVDVLSRFPISTDIAKEFRETRMALLTRSLRYGRLLISCFCLLMFYPFSIVQKLKVFRHHYYDIESVINRTSHLTDFMHNKNRI